MSRSTKGPWIRPKVDTFDGRAFYAGKTVFDGRNRYIYGWNPTKVEIKGLTGKWMEKNGTVSCCSEDGYSASIADKIPLQCCIKVKCKYHGNPTRFGLALQIDEDFDFGYYLMFEPDFNRIEFRSGLRMYEHGGQMFPYETEMERPMVMEADREYELELYIQNTMAVLYVDNDLAFGFRMYNWKERHLGFFISEGELEVQDALILT